MRKLFAALALAGLLAPVAVAQDKKDPSKREKPGVTLKVGDAAPALKATKWLQGDEVKSFETGKVYIVEFWATWCGPCIVMMPHMAEMQAEYKDRGVTFIGFTAKDEYGNDEGKATAFVKKRGPKLKYAFAYDDGKDTYNAWMQAAGRGGIPCCFVVDKAGKIAYIGHPMFLDVVLPKVVEGKWDVEKSSAEMADVEKQVNGVFGVLNGKDPAASLKTLTEFETKNPALAHIPYFLGPKLSLLLLNGKTEEARKVATAAVEKAGKYDDTTALRAVCNVMRSEAAKGDKEVLAVALQAANKQLEVSGDKDATALLNVAETHLALADKEKGAEFAARALEAADAAMLRTVCASLRTAARGDKGVLNVVLKAANKRLEQAGDKDALALLDVAETHLALGEKDRGAEFARKAIEAGDQRTLRAVSSELRTAARGDKDVLALALKAAEKLLEKTGEKDYMALFNMAETQFAVGEKDRGSEYGKKAVEAAPANLKRFLQQRVKALEAEAAKPKPEAKTVDQ